jgi:hypothetical protein
MDYSWSIAVLTFDFLLLLNHDDVTWDCPKRKDLGKRMIILTHGFRKRIKGTMGIL